MSLFLHTETQPGHVLRHEYGGKRGRQFRGRPLELSASHLLTRTLCLHLGMADRCCRAKWGEASRLKTAVSIVITQRKVRKNHSGPEIHFVSLNCHAYFLMIMVYQRKLAMIYLNGLLFSPPTQPLSFLEPSSKAITSYNLRPSFFLSQKLTTIIPCFLIIPLQLLSHRVT